MNLNSVARRINQLETRGRKKTGSIMIVNGLTAKPWTVLKDGEDFATLAEAVKHVKIHYSTKKIKVDQSHYLISKTSRTDLRKIASQTLPADDPVYKPFRVPCDVLAEVEKNNPDISFQLYFMTDNERRDYLKDHSNSRRKTY